MAVNIPSQIVVQTAAEWAADATVYSAKRILVTSDVFYTGTDQPRFKFANGTDAWADLDYVPEGGGGGASYTLVWFTQSINPADSTEYWFSPAPDITAAAGTNGNKRHKIPVDASEFTLNVGLATGGSTEPVTWRIRNHTQGTSADFTPTHPFTASGQANAYTGTATLSCTAGDYIEITMVTPVWTTNPTSLRVNTILNF